MHIIVVITICQEITSKVSKKFLLNLPRIFASSLKCFLEHRLLLDYIFCFKLFLKYRSAITSHLKQFELLFQILFLNESSNSRNVLFLLIVSRIMLHPTKIQNSRNIAMHFTSLDYSSLQTPSYFC